MNAYAFATKLEGHWRRVSEHRLKAFGPKEWNKVHGALQEIGYVFQREVRERIKNRAYAPNHPMTKLIRHLSAGGYLASGLRGLAGIPTKTPGRGVPLISTAQMVNAIRNHKMGTYKDPVLFVGIPRTQTRSGGPGNNMYRLAHILHEGFTIKVTPNMRKFLAANGLPLKASTTTLMVPKREFVAEVATDPKFVAMVRKNFKTSITDIWFTR
jgi:hypothetical protein